MITSVGHRGDGVAQTADGPVYVPYTLPGETVTVAAVPGHPDRRSLLRVDQASTERIAPICGHFGRCGGCATQHWAPDQYRAWKRDLVVSALGQAGVTAQVGDLIDSHGEGRRRVTLHARRGTHDILEVGFTGLRSHDVVGIDHCPILAPGLAGVIEAAWEIAEVLRPTGKPLDIQATASDAGMDIDVRGSGPLAALQLTELARIAERRNLARLSRHGELVIQRAAPTIRIGRAVVSLPPGSFLQATEEGEATLARLVLQHIGRAKNVADLFCGVGPFALRAAENAKVIAVDGDSRAIEALTKASGAPGLKPITGMTRDLFRRPLTASDLKPFDAVIIDPPRQGAEAQTREIAASDVAAVVGVSCNPATFARDAKILVTAEFRIAEVTPVDQFRYSSHVEIVARFER